MSFKTSNIFVNVPVSDLEKSKAFFSALGFSFNPQFTSEKAACMIVGDHMFAMLLTHEIFSTFTRKSIADATQSTEVLIGISASSREEVDRLADAALANGAERYSDPVDHGFMYQRAFADLDGHQWEVIWMNPEVIQSNG